MIAGDFEGVMDDTVDRVGTKAGKRVGELEGTCGDVEGLELKGAID